MTPIDMMESVSDACSKYYRFSCKLISSITDYLHSLVAFILICSSIARVCSISVKAAAHLIAKAGF